MPQCAIASDGGLCRCGPDFAVQRLFAWVVNGEGVMRRTIVTVMAVSLAAACTKKNDEQPTNVAAVEDMFGIYEEPPAAVNPNLENLRYTLRAFTDESTRLDHATLAVVLDAIGQALYGVPYADTSDQATEVHRVAEVLRTMGPSSTHRSETIREGLKAAVAALNTASMDERYSVNRNMIADVAREVDALDPQRPVAKQAFQVKLAICDTANAIAVMPPDGLSQLPCTRLPAASAALDLNNQRPLR
jgi:hypothetical protein